MNEVRYHFGRYGYAALIFLHYAILIISLLYLVTPWFDEECRAFGYFTVVGYIMSYLWYFLGPSIEEKRFSEMVLISGTGFALCMHVNNLIFALY